MDREPTKTAVRNAKREQRLGRDAACAFCGLKEPAALLPVTDLAVADALRQTLLERHHVLGRAHDSELTIIVCRNCHAIVTESQRCGAVPMRPQANVLDRLIACLRSVAALLEDARNAVERFLEDLEVFASFLDAQLPSWRKLWRNRK